MQTDGDEQTCKRSCRPWGCGGKAAAKPSSDEKRDGVSSQGQSRIHYSFSKFIPRALRVLAETTEIGLGK
jgi:hypothetical protein